jgi:tRNA(fMet)-specific endonuclease VapC
LGSRAARAAGGADARGAPLARLILDTTILIEGERREARLDELIDDEDDVAVAALTAAELLVGVELADRRRRGPRGAYVERILREIPIEEYDLAVARAHAVLLAHARRSGRGRGAHDLIIAATAASTNRTLVTADPAGFDGLPGVVVRS